MYKFLATTWTMAPENGQANFDINRENFQIANPSFAVPGFEPEPTKLQVFEQELEYAILAGQCPEESALVKICFDHGVRRQHAESILKRLKEKNRIKCGFRVPQLDSTREIIVL